MGSSPCSHACQAPYYGVLFCPEKSRKNYKKTLKSPYFSTNFTNSTNLQLIFVYFRQFLFFSFVSSLIISLYFIVLFAYSSVDNIVKEFRRVRIHFKYSLKRLYVIFFINNTDVEPVFFVSYFTHPANSFVLLIDIGIYRWCRVVDLFWYIVAKP